MDGFKGFLTSRKRKIEEEEEELDRYFFKKRNCDEEEDTSDVLLAALAATGILGTRKERKQRGPKRFRDKTWWICGYDNWDHQQFKTRLRISRGTFELLLRTIRPHIEKQQTNWSPYPITPHRQLALTLYRLAHGTSYSTVADLFILCPFYTSTFFLVHTFFVVACHLQYRNTTFTFKNTQLKANHLLYKQRCHQYC